MSSTKRCLSAIAMTWLSACGGSTPPPSSTSSAVTVSQAPSSSAAPASREKEEPVSLQQEAKQKPDMPARGASLDRVMRAHFHDALLIRQAVIAGTPEQAANAATVLSLIEDLDELPPGWREFVESMQLAARRITDSTSSAQAAAAAADLGVACGRCHQKLGGPRASDEAPPAIGHSVEMRMKRHEWATERLWEGLVVPSSDAWSAGARALAGDGIPDDMVKPGGVHARSAASDFTKLVAAAPGKKTTEERAALYAELLVTCGTCHRALREHRVPARGGG